MPGNRWKGVDLVLLMELYKKGMRHKDIAQQMGLGVSTVSLNLQKLGLTKRWSGGRAEVFQARARSCGVLNRDFIGYFDGLVMSDGYLRPLKQSLISCYSQFCKHREWLEVIRIRFLEVGIEGSIKEDVRPGKSGWILRTLSYKELGEQRARWYPGGEKKIPINIDFSNSTLWNNFVCGDGYYRGTALELGLDKYGKEQVLWVKEVLKGMGFSFEERFVGISKKGREKWRLIINVSLGVDAFYDFMGSPPLSFVYKWPDLSKGRSPWKSHRK